MRFICPNCGEVSQYKIKENSCREAIYNLDGELIKRTKYECFNLGKPRCVKCGSSLKVQVKILNENQELLTRT